MDDRLELKKLEYEKKVKKESLENPFPLVGVTISSKNESSLGKEINYLKSKDFDLLEIRGDYFLESFNKDLEDKKEEALSKDEFEENLLSFIISSTKNFIEKIKKTFKDKKILFTLRSKDEGGFFSGDYNFYFKVIKKVLKEDLDFIDVEFEKMKNEEGLLGFKEKMKDINKNIILSYHKIGNPLKKEEIISLYNDMEKYSPKIIKIVYMADKKEDLEALFLASKELKKRKTNFSLLSMGKYGYISRYLGFPLGSSLVFAKGYKPSASGQVTTEKLQMFYKSYREAYPRTD